MPAPDVLDATRIFRSSRRRSADPLASVSYVASSGALRLYSDDQLTAPWGEAVSTIVRGTVVGQSAASVPVYGRVPLQGPIPVGIYSDTVVVTVTYR